MRNEVAKKQKAGLIKKKGGSKSHPLIILSAGKIPVGVSWLFLQMAERRRRSVLFSVFEFHDPVGQCEEGMVFSDTNVEARVMDGSALADDDTS